MSTSLRLTRGLLALVDDDDLDRVSRFKWQAGFVSGRWRAQTWISGNGKQKTILLHRLITNAPTGLVVDHINGNALDNRKGNLRICSREQNAQNQTIRVSSTYKGITKKGRSFIAQLGVHNRKIHIGSFASADDAARAYDTHARNHFGQFAAVNFPNEGEVSCQRV